MVLRSLLKSWLRQAALDQLQEKLRQAARAGVSAAQASDSASDDSRIDPSTEAEADAGAQEAANAACDVAVVFATSSESGGLEDRLTDVVKTRAAGFVIKQGSLQGRHLVLAEAGRGQAAARAAALAVVKGHQPRLMIAAGFASGVSQEIGRGDILMVDEIVGEDDRRWSLDLNIRPEDLAKVPGTHVGRLVSLDRSLRKPAEKAQLGIEKKAFAVDRESLAVARACRLEGVPLLAVRVIVDAVEDPLCAVLDPRIQQQSTARRWGATVGALINQPGSLKEMVQEKQDLLVASDRLGRFLSDIVGQLAAARD